MSEIEKKATQIAQESVINVQPFDFASIEYGAIKMGYWMEQQMTEKAEKWFWHNIENFLITDKYGDKFFDTEPAFEDFKNSILK